MIGTPVYATHTATYGTRTVTYKVIVTNHDNIMINSIGTSHICNASGSPYGINGTFFYNYSSANQMPAGAVSAGYSPYDNYLIVMNDGVVVRNKGDKNRLNASSDGNCGTFGWFKQPVSGASYFCKDITTISDAGTTVSNVKWAIGGCNLYLDDANMTQTTFQSKVNDQSSGNVTNTTARTAIFYRPGLENDIALLAGFGSSDTVVVGSSGGPTLWELRSFIRSVFGTNCVGISLDGGGSAQIAYKSNNNRICVQAEQRAVRTMIQTPMF